MKITILADNNTYIDHYLLGEPAASYYLEIDGRRILLDTGYSQVFIQNAEKLEVDLSHLSHLVFSHGHNDHTRGLVFLAEKVDLSPVTVVAHPHCFLPKRAEEGSIGSPLSLQEISGIAGVHLSKEPYGISENCIFLGEIPQLHDFEQRRKLGERKFQDQWEPDYVWEDSALACKTPRGLFILTGCSHSGICSIIEYAKQVCRCSQVAGVLGGFHLFEEDQRLEKTIAYLEKQNMEFLWPAHCVSLKAKIRMAQRLPVQEAGSGLVLEL